MMDSIGGAGKASSMISITSRTSGSFSTGSRFKVSTTLALFRHVAQSGAGPAPAPSSHRQHRPAACPGHHSSRIFAPTGHPAAKRSSLRGKIFHFLHLISWEMHLPAQFKAFSRMEDYRTRWNPAEYPMDRQTPPMGPEGYAVERDLYWEPMTLGEIRTSRASERSQKGN